MSYGLSYEKKESSSDKEYSPIPEGRYASILTDCVYKKIGTKGTLVIDMMFKIDGGSESGRTFKHQLWFTDKAYNGTAAQLDSVFVFDKMKEKVEKSGGFKTIDQFGSAASKCLYALLGKKFEVYLNPQGKNDAGYEDYFMTLTHYIDVPNLAVQVPRADDQAKTTAGAGPAPAFDENEEITF